MKVRTQIFSVSTRLDVRLVTFEIEIEDILYRPEGILLFNKKSYYIEQIRDIVEEGSEFIITRKIYIRKNEH